MLYCKKKKDNCYAWNGRSARPCVPPLIFTLFSRHCLSPRARDTRRGTTYAFQSWPFPPSLSCFFSFLSSFLYSTDVVSPSQTAFTTTRRAHAHSSFLFYPPFYALILSPFNHPSVTPRSRYNADLRGGTHVYKTALLLVDEGIDPNQAASPLFSLISVPPSFSATALWNRSPSRPISLASALSTDLSSLSAFHPPSLGTSYSPRWLFVQRLQVVIRNIPQVQAPVLDAFST